jgi:hypothetical protein
VENHRTALIRRIAVANLVREERLVFGDVTVVIRVSAEDSGGAMTVIEEVPPMEG